MLMYLGLHGLLESVVYRVAAAQILKTGVVRTNRAQSLFPPVSARSAYPTCHEIRTDSMIRDLLLAGGTSNRASFFLFRHLLRYLLYDGIAPMTLHKDTHTHDVVPHGDQASDLRKGLDAPRFRERRELAACNRVRPDGGPAVGHHRPVRVRKKRPPAHALAAGRSGRGHHRVARQARHAE